MLLICSGGLVEMLEVTPGVEVCTLDRAGKLLLGNMPTLDCEMGRLVLDDFQW